MCQVIQTMERSSVPLSCNRCCRTLLTGASPAQTYSCTRFGAGCEAASVRQCRMDFPAQVDTSWVLIEGTISLFYWAEGQENVLRVL
jgi:hypothetical protein